MQLSPIDLSAVPQACQPLARRAQSPGAAIAMPARISLASCMADHAVAPLALCDCAASIVAIDEAVEPALALLDELIDAADPAAQVTAAHTEGQLYAGWIARLMATLPRVEAGASEAAIALADARSQALRAQLAPWREAAATAFQAVVELAKDHPELANHPVVTAAVRDSAQRLAADAAAR